MSFRPLLSIVGPTATGKTDLAFDVAQTALAGQPHPQLELTFPLQPSGVDLISVDSRQVYQDLAITSGADIPADFQLATAKNITFLGQPTRFFTNPTGTIHLFGVALLTPDQPWSVAHFQEYAHQVIEQSWNTNRLPILVGGTGLYHRHLFNPQLANQPVPDEKFRQSLANLTTAQLQEKLTQLNKSAFLALNHSDQANPRRLVRAIERAMMQQQLPQNQPNQSASTPHRSSFAFFPALPTDHHTVFVSADLETLQQRIAQRVAQRFGGGAVAEVAALLRNYSLAYPAQTATGVPEIAAFLRQEMSEQACLELWILHEFQYAKRQLTWWKKHLPADAQIIVSR